MTTSIPVSHRPIVLLSIVAVSIGCGHGNSAAGPRTLPAPERVGIAAQPVTYGFALGTIREQVSLPAFSISQTPVTVGAYRACVESGICTKPNAEKGACSTLGGADGRTYSDSPTASDLPVTCLTPAQASRYCQSVGGRLPRVGEWMLAARGPAPHRYAWGDDPPTCERSHRLSYFASYPDACCGARCSAPEVGLSKQHPKGQSALGLQDVLVTRAELLGPELQQTVHGCSAGSGACLVTGNEAGAIDGLAAAPTTTEQSFDLAFSFRCAWDGEQK